MLNPILYGRLHMVYGNVEIVNEDTDKEQYRLNCPFCGETRKRLYIGYQWGSRDSSGISQDGALFCHNEKCHRNTENILELMYRVWRSVPPVFITQLKPARKIVTASKVEWPGDTIRLNDLAEVSAGHEVLYYLRERGYDPLFLGRRYKLGYCNSVEGIEDDELREKLRPVVGRLVIPIFMDNRLVHWTARHIGAWTTQQYKQYHVRKYYNRPGSSAGSVLFGIDNAKQYRTIILTEGGFDAMRTGLHSVATFGSNLTDTQTGILKQLYDFHEKKLVIFVCYDNDKGDNAFSKRAAAKLRDAGCERVYLIDMPVGVDPADMQPGELSLRVNDHAVEKGIKLDWRPYDAKDFTTCFSGTADAGTGSAGIVRRCRTQRFRTVSSG